MPALANDAPVTALMEIGVSCRVVSLFKAVTTTSSMPLEGAGVLSADTPCAWDWAAAQPAQPDRISPTKNRRAALKLLVMTLPYDGVVRSSEIKYTAEFRQHALHYL